MDSTQRKPKWLKAQIPGGQGYTAMSRLMREHKLHTVCEEAKCPNLGECWSKGAATVMILGDTCTRALVFAMSKRDGLNFTIVKNQLAWQNLLN
jgi:lipoic acid synthetase